MKKITHGNKESKQNVKYRLVVKCFKDSNDELELKIVPLIKNMCLKTLELSQKLKEYGSRNEKIKCSTSSYEKTLLVNGLRSI